MRFILGAWEVRRRCTEGAGKVHRRCAGGVRKVHGTYAEGAREVHGRWVITGNLNLKAYFELLKPL